MNRIVLFLVMGLTPILLDAQNPNGNYNPYVDGGTISPSPLLPSEDKGKGILSFNIGNTGTDALEVYTSHYIILTITLSHGIPDNEDPLLAISGSLAGHFSWSYNAVTGTYSAVQVTEIPANSTGTVDIAFEVAKNSSSPGANGFNVNITPSPYQTTSNDQNDDAVSSYTFTEKTTTLGVIEASRISIFPNPSDGEFMIDLKEVSGRFLLEIIALNGSIVKKDVVHLKGIPVTMVLNEYIPGLYHIRLYNAAQSFQEELILE